VRAQGFVYTGTNEAGETFVLTFEKARECAAKEAGPEPSLHDLLRSYVEHGGAHPS
jgi:hypothetical protein